MIYFCSLRSVFSYRIIRSKSVFVVRESLIDESFMNEKSSAFLEFDSFVVRILLWLNSYSSDQSLTSESFANGLLVPATNYFFLDVKLV